ncbi:hypothetical protein ADK54_02865 [Streptomyces sp. WM6378]|nr:hypothetical protein ADK54_02865 [Streptomyces sp. WM6378]
MNSGDHRALDVRPLAGPAHLLTMAQERGSVADRLSGWMFRLVLCEQAATSALICAGWSIPALLGTPAYEEAWQQDQFPAYRADSDGEFVPLGRHFRQLFGQLIFEFIQFRASRGDPFQQLGIQHAPDRRRLPNCCERESAS